MHVGIPRPPGWVPFPLTKGALSLTARGFFCALSGRTPTHVRLIGHIGRVNDRIILPGWFSLMNAV